MSIEKKYWLLCEIMDNLENYYEQYGDDEAHATIQTEYKGSMLKSPLKRDGGTWYINDQWFRNTSTLIDYIFQNDLLKQPLR